ncbi:ABC transporter permease [Myxococcus llanfairpwllgwyngyllgogerychwyrndrobwllllantysiliogogogochensis]|uniref:ABC transporter permease n=1 Tax=Myxococcus llanfairpwllgwyngyllgogerychwyrndrobwllllantysiliogogogochensis TaxID=2590453 RepID=A0A540X4H4_9BACT|nr:ABC transporter permease subunit [Myxococcus llanfairpwllgwyngyllgogerychwyrndrobwllllantysiliogogogochensis]TQF16158.1 ABC transporter permease [Myxococcus llanfairpwllgwyngyllgogerychwyrndrobwllllantysiliogogogochensis]
MRRLIGTVFRKELRDYLRDRRTASTSLLWALLAPLLFLVLINVMASWRKDKPLELPVVGREHAPSLMAFLSRLGVTLKDAPEDYEERIRAGSLDVVLLVPQDYGRDFSSGRTADVNLIMDSSRQSAQRSVQRAQRLLQGYSRHVGDQRLYARGMAPELAMPVRVEELDLSTPERTAAMVLNMLPFFLVMAAFGGGMQLASDTMAGERERGSLEPLLLNPVPHGALVTGKWLATVAMAGVTVLGSLACFIVVVRHVPLEDLGVRARFDAAATLGMVAAILPLALAVSALQMWVATYARSFKEAQMYQSMLMVVPMLPGMMLMLSPMQTKLWMFAVPVVGQQLLAGEVLRGEVLGPMPFLIAAASCVAVTLVSLRVTTGLLSQERIVFGRS